MKAARVITTRLWTSEPFFPFHCVLCGDVSRARFDPVTEPFGSKAASANTFSMMMSPYHNGCLIIRWFSSWTSSALRAVRRFPDSQSARGEVCSECCNRIYCWKDEALPHLFVPVPADRLVGCGHWLHVAQCVFSAPLERFGRLVLCVFQLWCVVFPIIWDLWWEKPTTPLPSSLCSLLASFRHHVTLHFLTSLSHFVFKKNL